MYVILKKSRLELRKYAKHVVPCNICEKYVHKYLIATNYAAYWY